MKTKTHSNKLQKSSGVFLPLGLVLTLLTVYGLFETKTMVTSTIPNTEYVDRVAPYDFVQQKEIQVERPKTETPQTFKKQQRTDPTVEFTTTEDLTHKEEDLPFESTPDTNPKDNNLEDWVEVPEKDIVEDVAFVFIEDAPIFPGCERVKGKKQRKACFSKKMSKFISRKFNNNLAENLGLTPGKQKIYVQFKITKSGDIEIIGSSAPHIRLEKEGERIVNLLPKMTPGMQRGKPVNVTYMLPITFQVD